MIALSVLSVAAPCENFLDQDLPKHSANSVTENVDSIVDWAQME
jgi:hypothetical protein